MFFFSNFETHRGESLDQGRERGGDRGQRDEIVHHRVGPVLEGVQVYELYIYMYVCCVEGLRMNDR